MYKAFSNFLTDRSKAVLRLWIVNSVLCHTVSSIPCSLVVTSWERADLLALLYVMFVTFLYDVVGQVWYLIVWIPDIFLLPYISPNTKENRTLKYAFS